MKFEESYRIMLFSNGDRCWNGPDRSLKVPFVLLDQVHVLIFKEIVFLILYLIGEAKVWVEKRSG